MKRSVLNYTVDMGMFISFVAVVLTGIAKFPLLLRTLARRGLYLPSGEITFIHEWGGALMAVCILLHLILHWNWVLSSTRRIFVKKRSVTNSKISE